MVTNIIKFPVKMRESLDNLKKDSGKIRVSEVISEACNNLIKDNKKGKVVYKNIKYGTKNVIEVNLALEDELHLKLKMLAVLLGKGVTLRKVILFACQRLINNSLKE